MRGKVLPFSKAVNGSWITPAYAGKSTVYAIGDGEPEDHPRLCGEKFRLASTLGVALGSMPLT